MFPVKESKSFEARVIYGEVDNMGWQDINIEILGVGAVVATHDANAGVVSDFGFDWYPETAYRALFGTTGTVGKDEPKVFDWADDSSMNVEPPEPA